MKTENFKLLIQIIDSMNLIANELEKAIEKNDAEKVRKSKQEIMNLQKELEKLVK